MMHFQLAAALGHQEMNMIFALLFPKIGIFLRPFFKMQNVWFLCGIFSIQLIFYA